MLWLNKKSIKNISRDEYIDVIQKRFHIRKILQYSKKSFICLTSKNTIVKILNPDLSKYQYRNFLIAKSLFSKCGIKTPRNLSVNNIGEFHVIESQYINSQLFFNKKPPLKADEAFFCFFDQLSQIKNNFFGPLITQRKFLPPAFLNTRHSYLQYWSNQLNYFLNKIPNKSFRQRAKKYYNILHSKIKIPNRFILSHSDISPKHIFMDKSYIGCIDLEETMYLDDSFMWGIWYVRTIQKRNEKINNKFFEEFILRNLDLNLFNFHAYRELLIQYYYQGLLDCFFRDYFKFLKSFNSFIIKLT